MIFLGSAADSGFGYFAECCVASLSCSLQLILS